MSNINNTITKFQNLLSQEATSFDLSQKMQFEWLQSIDSQLDFFDTDPHSKSPSNRRISFQDPPKKLTPCHSPKFNDENRDHSNNRPAEQKNLNIPVPSFNNSNDDDDSEENNESDLNSGTLLSRDSALSSTTPCFRTSNSIKFVDDNSLLLESSDDDNSDEESEMNGPPVPYTLAGSFNELTQSASSFREKWLEMLHQKKASTNQPKKPFKFAFEDEEDEMPEAYQISDDDGSDDDNAEDDEMYERNPVEIHGKTIPTWARGDLLLKQLKKQQRIDPDSIFSEFTADSLDLPAVFNTNKSKWQNRSDSGYWDHDKVTEEEVLRFKTALNLQ